MRYLITGGGTGGHIYPALAIADKIKKEDESAEILYVGTEKGLEAQLAPRAGYDYRPVRVKSLPRKLNKDLLIAIKELLLGLNDSRRIMKDFRPDVVIGTGGYVCGPVVLAGHFKGAKTIIHEQNSYPGITNKILARFVDRVLITFKEAEEHFPQKNKLALVGNPVREEIGKVDKSKAHEKLGLRKDLKTLLVFGGSGGQKSINDNLLEIIEDLGKQYQILFVTGQRLFDQVQEELASRPIKIGENTKIIPYLYDMPEALNICDLIISSAGAISLSEIASLGLASILIPKSYSAENHQEYNARAFKDQGAAELIYERDLNPEILKTCIENLMEDESKLESMREKSRQLNFNDAGQNIFEEIRQLTL